MNFLWAIALLVASYAITALLTPKPKSSGDAAASMFKDVQFPIAEEGSSQAVVFGDCWTPDFQVIWYGNMKTETIKAGSGGKK